MLSPHGLWTEDLTPYRSRWILTGPALEPWQRKAYFALREQVFVHEQKLFADSDVDAHDDRALHLCAMATSAGMVDEVVGVVRIYEASPGLWHGGRLAVSRPYRRSYDVGSALIRAAVGAARGLGARRFLATIQLENVPYFERNHFSAREPSSVCGRPHLWMEADLTAFAVPGWLGARRAA